LEIVRSHSNNGYILAEGIMVWITVLILLSSLFATLKTALKFTQNNQRKNQRLLDQHHKIMLYYKNNEGQTQFSITPLPANTEMWKLEEINGKSTYGFRFK
jgi:hypothetical protein